jgi:hypothetical protein
MLFFLRIFYSFSLLNPRTQTYRDNVSLPFAPSPLVIDFTLVIASQADQSHKGRRGFMTYKSKFSSCLDHLSELIPKNFF